MFGAPGHLYVYLVYGHAPLRQRGLRPGRPSPRRCCCARPRSTEGQDLARRRRGEVPDERLAAGPGNLGAAFGLDRALNGADLLAGPVRLARGARPPRIEQSPADRRRLRRRMGGAPDRFSIADDPHRSRR